MLIDKNVPVDPAVEGADELKDKDRFAAPVYSKLIRALAKQPGRQGGSPSASKSRSDMLSIARCHSSRQSRGASMPSSEAVDISRWIAHCGDAWPRRSQSSVTRL